MALHSLLLLLTNSTFVPHFLLPCVNLPFGFATFSLFRLCMLQVVTFNLIKSLLRKSKINALLFNSNKLRNFCCLHWQSQSVAKRSVARVSRRYDLQLRHKATAADRQRKWNRERETEREIEWGIGQVCVHSFQFNASHTHTPSCVLPLFCLSCSCHLPHSHGKLDAKLQAHRSQLNKNECSLLFLSVVFRKSFLSCAYIIYIFFTIFA